MENTGSNQWPTWIQISLTLVGLILGVVLVFLRYRRDLRDRSLRSEQKSAPDLVAASRSPKGTTAKRSTGASTTADHVAGAPASRALEVVNEKSIERRPSPPEYNTQPTQEGTSKTAQPVAQPEFDNRPKGNCEPEPPTDNAKAAARMAGQLPSTTPLIKPINLSVLPRSWQAPVAPIGGPTYISAGVGGLASKPIRYIPHGRFSKLNVADTYPVTEMPVAPSVSAGTMVGRPGPRGYSEAGFYGSLMLWFNGHLRRDDRMVFIGAARDYEPDMILHFEDAALRIDIEIDEPYSGSTRMPMHWVGSYDDDRDLYFTRNGWVVIRFAEIQVMQQRDACIKHVAQVVDSLLSTSYASRMQGPDIMRIPRWSHAQAAQWGRDNFRESYLYIEFERRTESPGAIEAEQDIVRTRPQGFQGFASLSVRDTGLADLSPQERQLKIKLEGIIDADMYARFLYDGEIRLIKPARVSQERARHLVNGNDLVTRENQQYELRRISDLQVETVPIVRAAKAPSVGDLNEAVAMAMDNQLYFQITYINNEGVIRQRTLSNLAYNNEYVPMGYLDQHIKGYCTFRKMERTFKIDRIREYAILNLSYAAK